MINIDPSGDLVVRATEIIKNDRGVQVVSHTETFRVRRQVLMQASVPWSHMLDPYGPYREGVKDVVELDETPIFSFEILLRELHHSTRASHVYDASILDVWQLLGLTKRWLIKTVFLNPYFAMWYSAQKFDKKNLDELEQRQLLFPCYQFDHAEGFARATRFLAYTVCGQIEEDNPIEHDELHLPVFTTHMLNSARVRLGLILTRELFKVNDALLKATCKCKGDTLHGYELKLKRVGIWPFHETLPRNDISTLLEQLKKFRYKVANKRACIKNCQLNYGAIAQHARRRTAGYFDGLCIDCMNRKKPKLKDHHADFWNFNNFRDQDGWFDGCRIRHKQPSWYYSFMGREEDKNILLGRSNRHKGPRL